MRTPFLFAVITFLSLSVFDCRAEIIGYESFSYRGATIAGADGGAFWDYRNNTTPGHTTEPSNWDIAPGLPDASAWSGGVLFTGNSGVIRQFCGPDAAGEATGAVSDTSSAKKVYLSVLMTRGTGASWCGISAFDGTAERAFFGLFPDSTGKFTIYDQNTFTRLALSTADVTVGRTYRLVAKVDYAANVVALYVDPDFSRAESFSTPVATAAYPAAYTTTALRLASGPGGLTQWDDLTVATTWASLQTYQVTNMNDSGAGSLRVSCAAAAAAGARVTFAPLDEEYEIVLTGGEIALTGVNGLVIDGPEHSGVTIRGGSGRIFRVGNTTAVAVRNLTFAGGNAFAYPALPAPGQGGGAVTSDGVFTADRCLFRDNRADYGGAVRAAGLFRLHRCTFYGNFANLGGALITDGLFGSAIARVIHCTFTENRGAGTFHSDGAGAQTFLQSCVLEKTISNLSTRNISKSGAGTLAAEACVISNADGSFITATAANRNVLGTDAAPLRDILAGLDYYGGGVIRTAPPVPGSPAIDISRTAANHGGDARGLAMQSFPDAGAAEYQGRADLALYWNADWDGDGVTYGVEQGSGTDPRVPDASHNANLRIIRTGTGASRLYFTRLHAGLVAAPPGLAWTRWRLKASGTPSVPGSWVTIYTYDGPTRTTTLDTGVTSTNLGDGLGTTMPVEVTDLLANPFKQFYRLEAELLP